MVKKFIVAGVCVFALSPLAVLAASFFTISDAGDFGFGTDSPLHKIDVVGSIYSRLVSLSDSSTIAVDWNDGNTQVVTLGGNRTLTFANAQAGGHYMLILKQDLAGNRTVTWPSGILWNGGSAPSLSTVGAAADAIAIIYDGSTYLGKLDISGAPAVVATENFNLYSDGNLNGGSGGIGWTSNWTADGGNTLTFNVQGTTTVEGTKTIKATEAAGTEGSISRTFTSQTHGRVHWAQRKDGIYHVPGVALLSGSTLAATVWMDGDPARPLNATVFAMRDGGSEITTGTSYSTSAWNTVDLEFDTSTDKYRVSINGGAYTGWKDFANAVTSLDTLQIFNGGSGASTVDEYWDDIRITE